MLRQTGDVKDIITELSSDLRRKKSAVESRLKNQGADFRRLEEKGKGISKLRSIQTKNKIGEVEEQAESGLDALKFFGGTAGLNYHVRGNVGDTGGLSGFWNYMEKSFENIAKTIDVLPKSAKIGDYLTFDGDKWKLLRKSYNEAAAKWERLK
jgi:hypothetical protein